MSKKYRAIAAAGSYSFEAANPRHEHEYHLLEVHDAVVWEKFKAMRAGADLASRQLWARK